MRLFSKNLRITIFARTVKLVFSMYLFFIFFKIAKKNFMVFNKIGHIYPVVQQRWSNAHQLVDISIIINCLLFYSTFSVYLSNFLSFIILSCLYAFAAIDIQPPMKVLFFRLTFSSSFVDFEKVFR